MILTVIIVAGAAVLILTVVGHVWCAIDTARDVARAEKRIREEDR